MVLEPPESVWKLQRALQTKAKGTPGYRFYLLYDKLYRKDVLKYAYDRCKANKGAPGVDGQDFADIEAYGEERWLDEMWVEAPVEEDDGHGGTKRTTTAKDTGRGVPQGAPISPLLANLYMRRFVLGWKKRGLETRLGAKIVSYADDFVICCKGSAEEAMTEMRRLMAQLGLTVNEVRHLPEGRFDFLGYDFGRYYSPKTGRAYLCPQPSKKSVRRMIGKIRNATERRVLWLSAEDMVKGLNRMLVGWAKYYSLGPVHKAYRAIDRYTPLRLRRWLCNKHSISNTGARCFPYEYPHGTLGLVKLESLAHGFPRAKV